MAYEAVTMGVSAGGIDALKRVLGGLPEAFPMAIAIVQHRDERSDGYLSDYLNQISPIRIKEAEGREPLQPGHAYLAPGGYHLLIEPDFTFGLSVDPHVNFARPSVDVLFESAAFAYGPALIGIVLTGGNSDGAAGLKTIKARGGLAIVQDPDNAEAKSMPRAALAATAVDYVLPLKEIAPLLVRLSHDPGIKRTEKDDDGS